MSEITPELLIRAYASGLFPMAESRDSDEVFWIEPKLRGILPLDAFHISKSLTRTVRQDRFRVTVDKAFSDVIHACAETGEGREDSWINDRIIDMYRTLFDLGHVHSVECWRDEELVGGLYGVSIGAAFFGESMFHTATDASKVALAHLVGRMIAGGYTLLDTQFVTDHLKSFGTVEITQAGYRSKLTAALALSGDFYSLPDGTPGATIVQLITQTS